MSPADAFDLLRSALERAGVRYAVRGSWASTAFGEPRFTNDVDILAEFTEESLPAFLRFLPETFYVDAEDALNAFNRGRPFNVVHMPTVLKFDLFPSRAFPLGTESWIARYLYRTRDCRSSPYGLSRQKTFCWRNCIGYVRRLSTAVSWRKAPRSLGFAICWTKRTARRESRP
jgi:hypothetical protein